MNAKGLNKLPRNVQQMKNHRRSDSKKDSDVLYSVMVQCKMAEGKNDSFVRDVKAAPDPQCILYTDTQISDLVRFTTKSIDCCVLTADTTYNLGDFYVTPTTYRHLMIEDPITKKHPVVLGPILVHQRKSFSSFNYFASTLVGANSKLRNLQAYGTDGDPALMEAFSHNFHTAKQLRCFIHLKKNISGKLRDRGIPNNESKEFLADIFGKQCGLSYEQGLVDAENGNDFDGKLENCEVVWLERDVNYLRDGQAPFYTYFKTQYAHIVRNTMLKNVRIAVGLGSPPAIFTTNASESINAVIKRNVNFKATEWPNFNDSLKKIVDGQRDEAIRALSGRGQYRLSQEYQYLQINPQKWAVMTPQQRQQAVKQFDSAPLRNSKSQTEETCSNSTSTIADSKEMIVEPENTGIVSIPLATLKLIWAKATEYMNSSNVVVSAPVPCPKAKMVASRSTSAPHFVQHLPSGQYICDSNCLQWKSSCLCSHTVAVAGINGDLESFIDWYVLTKQRPNFTTLAVHGLPSGRGRKGGIPKRKKSKSYCSRDATTVLRPAVATCTGANYQPSGAGNLSSFGSTQSSTASSSPVPHCSQSVTGLSGMLCSSPLVSQNQTINIHPPLSHVSPTSNPFFLKFMQGNIRVCQGCKSSLRNLDGSLPLPPFDVVVARFERRTFRDKTGELRTPAREQAAHYHLQASCVGTVDPNFVLNVPSDVLTLLNATHKEYLRLMFNLHV